MVELPKSEEPTAKKSRRLSLGAFGISFLLHALLFLMIGSYVIIHHVEPRVPFLGDYDSPIESEPNTELLFSDDNLPESPSPDLTAPDLAMDPSSGGEESAVPLADILTTTSLHSTVNVMTAPMPTVAPPLGSAIRAGTGPGSGQGLGSRGAAASLFGRGERQQGGLRGIFYDTKFTPDRQVTEVGKAAQATTSTHNPTADRAFISVVRQFIQSGLRPSAMRGYYQGSAPLYATQFIFPPMDADTAPAAFNVETPGRYWFIHYSGRVRAPATKRYRFVGGADNLLVVFVDGRPVLDGSKPGNSRGSVTWTNPDAAYEYGYGRGRPGGMEYFIVEGQWINMIRDRVYNIDIIVGETPGGFFNAYLMIEEEGVHPRPAPGSLPRLPMFRTSQEFTTPRAGVVPLAQDVPFTTDGPVFEGVD